LCICNHPTLLLHFLFFILLFILYLHVCSRHLDLHSFPTRRSSDLNVLFPKIISSSSPTATFEEDFAKFPLIYAILICNFLRNCSDRKSTRLNSSHVSISYAVFCLKKKIHHTLS